MTDKDKIKMAIEILSYFADANNYQEHFGQKSWVMEEGRYYAYNAVKILMDNPKLETEEYKELFKLTKSK